MSNQLDRRIRQMMQRVVDESPPPRDVLGLRAITPIVRRQIPKWVAAVGSAAAILVVVGGSVLLVGMGDVGVGDVAANTTVATTASVAPVPAVLGVGDGQTVSVAVAGVSGHVGDELAGVLYAGGELTDLDRDAVGGFWWVVSGDDAASTTEVVREPGDSGVGRFPFVSDEALLVEPGMYTLVLWVDDGLGPVSRWVPVNSDGRGLFGCQVVFEVGDDAQTDVVVAANLQPDGWNVNCATGLAIPGTVSADPVTPSMDSWATFVDSRPTSMPVVSGVGDGQTVSVAVAGVSGHVGDELAGVLYAGGELTDLDRDAVGGFWWVVSGDDAASTTEVVREPGDSGVGRFPFVSDEALLVEPGMYTLVLWVDDGLGPVSRWVPVNSDGRGLFGCQVVFEVGDEAQTDVVVAANLQPDGWRVACTSH